VEFALIVPVFMVILVGMLEFGFVFTHHMMLEYATREGARTGAALADGDNNATVCAGIDPSIVAAVQRVLISPGSQITLAEVSQIRIWKANSAGAPIAGTINIWNYTGLGSGPSVDGQQLAFTQASQPWLPCSRDNDATPDSIGVSLDYTYRMVTPLSGLLRFFGGPGASSLAMADGTVMALNP
jgi:hypothetical protein